MEIMYPIFLFLKTKITYKTLNLYFFSKKNEGKYPNENPYKTHGTVKAISSPTYLDEGTTTRKTSYSSILLAGVLEICY